MRLSIVLLVLFFCAPGLAQEKKSTTKANFYSDKSKAQKELEITKAFRELDSALIAADTIKLKMLLYDQLNFIHSNGLVETKQDLLKHIGTGYLVYTKIEQSDSARIIEWGGKKGGYWHDHTVNRNLHVAGLLDGKPFDVKLKATEQWFFSNSDGWVLGWRKSEKVK